MRIAHLQNRFLQPLGRGTDLEKDVRIESYGKEEKEFIERAEQGIKLAPPFVL